MATTGDEITGIITDIRYAGTLVYVRLSKAVASKLEATMDNRTVGFYGFVNRQHLGKLWPGKQVKVLATENGGPLGLRISHIA